MYNFKYTGFLVSLKSKLYEVIKKIKVNYMELLFSLSIISIYEYNFLPFK